MTDFPPAHRSLTAPGNSEVGGTDPSGAYRFRAVRTLGKPVEDDPDVMVHQQIARLRFFERIVGSAGQRVLDFGCGSGFNCHELTQAADVLGFDASAAAIALARKSFPDKRFVVGDACDPAISLGTWDRILCCEVLEHVPDMPAFLDNIRRHLAADGIAFITTPNRPIFSLDHQPSPMNREHIKELDLPEFEALLKARFREVTIYGQRFTRPDLLEQWQLDVRAKIARLEAGTRWPAATVFPGKRGLVVRAARSFAPTRLAWKWLRWELMESVRIRRQVAARPYDFRDFEFSTDCSQALWLCAVAHP